MSSVNIDEARGLNEETDSGPTTRTMVSAEVVAFDVARSGAAGPGSWGGPPAGSDGVMGEGANVMRPPLSRAVQT